MTNKFSDVYKLVAGYIKIGKVLNIPQQDALVKVFDKADDIDCIVRTSNGWKAETGDLFDIIGHNPIFVVKTLDVFFNNGFITYNEDGQIIVNPYVCNDYHEEWEDIYYLFDNNKYFANFLCDAQNYLDKYNITVSRFDSKTGSIYVDY